MGGGGGRKRPPFINTPTFIPRLQGRQNRRTVLLQRPHGNPGFGSKDGVGGQDVHGHQAACDKAPVGGHEPVDGGIPLARSDVKGADPLALGQGFALAGDLAAAAVGWLGRAPVEPAPGELGSPLRPPLEGCPADLAERGKAARVGQGGGDKGRQPPLVSALRMILRYRGEDVPPQDMEESVRLLEHACGIEPVRSRRSVPSPTEDGLDMIGQGDQARRRLRPIAEVERRRRQDLAGPQLGKWVLATEGIVQASGISAGGPEDSDHAPLDCAQQTLGSRPAIVGPADGFGEQPVSMRMLDAAVGCDMTDDEVREGEAGCGDGLAQDRPRREVTVEVDADGTAHRRREGDVGLVELHQLALVAPRRRLVGPAAQPPPRPWQPGNEQPQDRMEVGPQAPRGEGQEGLAVDVATWPAEPMEQPFAVGGPAGSCLSHGCFDAIPKTRCKCGQPSLSLCGSLRGVKPALLKPVTSALLMPSVAGIECRNRPTIFKRVGWLNGFTKLAQIRSDRERGRRAVLHRFRIHPLGTSTWC